MYKNKIDNMNNLSGIAIRNLRIEKGWSQRELADALQLLGLDLDITLSSESKPGNGLSQILN